MACWAAGLQRREVEIPFIIQYTIIAVRVFTDLTPRENTVYHHYWYRADSRLAPSQWETSLQSNAVSHWLSANLESALGYTAPFWLVFLFTYIRHTCHSWTTKEKRHIQISLDRPNLQELTQNRRYAAIPSLWHIKRPTHHQYVQRCATAARSRWKKFMYIWVTAVDACQCLGMVIGVIHNNFSIK